MIIIIITIVPRVLPQQNYTLQEPAVIQILGDQCAETSANCVQVRQTMLHGFAVRGVAHFCSLLKSLRGSVLRISNILAHQGRKLFEIGEIESPNE